MRTDCVHVLCCYLIHRVDGFCTNYISSKAASPWEIALANICTASHCLNQSTSISCWVSLNEWWHLTSQQKESSYVMTDTFQHQHCNGKVHKPKPWTKCWGLAASRHLLLTSLSCIWYLSTLPAETNISLLSNSPKEYLNSLSCTWYLSTLPAETSIETPRKREKEHTATLPW